MTQEKLMTDQQRPSLRERVRAFPLGTEIIAVAYLGPRPVVVTAEEKAVFLADTTEDVNLHEGGILSFAVSGDRLVTGGDDGKLVALDAFGATKVLAEVKGRWIDQVALSPSGAFAYASGKNVFFHDGGKGETKSLILPSSAGGLAFFPKGTRLAIARYNGVTLWFPNTQGAPSELEWKGSHLGVTVSPDGRFVVTSMQEPQLHGWRLEDGRNMRMSGYPGKVRSYSWTAGGKFLATSGADSAILWPFTGKDGPMGAQPRMRGLSNGQEIMASAVAAHPKTDVLAVGFADGQILLVRGDDGAEILLRAPSGDRISALAWKADGSGIVYGTEGGEAGFANL